MGTIPENLQKLDSDEDGICYCHHGMRSLDVANWLRHQSVKSAKSLAGGIDRWPTSTPGFPATDFRTPPDLTPPLPIFVILKAGSFCRSEGSQRLRSAPRNERAFFVYLETCAMNLQRFPGRSTWT